MTTDIPKEIEPDRELTSDELDVINGSGGEIFIPTPIGLHGLVGIHPLNPQPLPP